ncbi:equilibrative nucleoside transporter 3-like [Gordionus sp. m RMFG-2023]|uniref:equilibrative nucleoside transporter 3-like n=1 Tax=Gordionus sp. m RMFG-2023 TaxID=3053472 RepID=UPI0031FD367F
MEKKDETLIENSQFDNEHSSIEASQFDVEEPDDRMYLVYIIMLIHGIGVLIPWNMFINANSYFVDYKLNPNVTGTHEYKDNFISYLGITSQLPNVLLNGMNLFLQFGGSKRNKTSQVYKTQPRIPIAIIIDILMCIFTVVLAFLNTSTWSKVFFILTMITVVIMNCATGIYQSSIYGLAGSLPMKYTNVIIIGNNICGTLVALVYIIVIYASPSPRLAAIWYFISAILILFVCLVSYFVLPRLRFYRHHLRTSITPEQIDELINNPRTRRYKSTDYSSVFNKIWVQCFGVFFCYFITLTIFPAIQVHIARKNSNFFIPDKYFDAILTFLNFNVFSLIGNLITEKIKMPSPKWVWLPILLRTVFIPLFLFCNYRPDIRKFPVWIKNDYVYALLGIVLSVTHGYFSSLTMMYAPRYRLMLSLSTSSIDDYAKVA